MIALIPSQDATFVWPLVKALVEAIEAEGRMGAADVLKMLTERRLQLWVGGSPASSVALTEILAYPRCRAVRVVYAAGDLETIAAGLPVLEAWAAEQGASSLEIVTPRHGWARVLPGFKPAFTIIRKELMP